MKRNFVNYFGRIALLFLWLSPASFAETEVGKVVSLSGKVLARIESSGAGRSRIPKVRALKPSDPIYREDVINTDSSGSVKILFQDQSILDLGSSSLFKIVDFQNKGNPEDRSVEMSLSYGKIRAAINQKIGEKGKFKIKTRAATMGVRGTEFYVITDLDSGSGEPESGGGANPASKPQTQIVVTEGKVEVSAPKGEGHSTGLQKPVEVLPGEKLTATLDLSNAGTGDQPPPQQLVPEKVVPEEMKAVTREIKLQDTTFAQAVKIDPVASSPGSSGGAGISFTGSETMAVIQDAILSKPENLAPLTPSGGFSVPGGPTAFPGASGNFLPGFITTPLVRLNVLIGPQ